MDFEQLTTTHSVYHLPAPYVLLILLTLSTQIILHCCSVSTWIYFQLFPQNISCFRPNLLVLHINKSMLFTVSTNILSFNFSVEWIQLILCKCVTLFKIFTRMEFRFSCAVTALKQFLCYHIAPFCCCILQSPCCDFCI
jgi:hypothetical protein